MGNEFTMEDILIIFYRRLKHFLIPIAILLPLLVIGVMVLPAKYTSQGVMLIESPRVSENLLRESSNSKALERVEIIRTRISSRPQLLDIAKQTGLFENTTLSETKKVKRMKKRMKVSPVTSQIVSGRSDTDVFAFNVSYTDKDALMATKVANEIINRFEQEDSKRTVKNASDQTEFLEDKTSELQEKLREQRDAIAEFKRVNDGKLPEQLTLHQQQLERYGQRLAAIDQQISSLEEDKRFVESQVSSVASGGGSENSPEQRLITQRAQLAELRARYTDSHPEVRALRAEIAAMEAQLRPGRDLRNLQRQLEEAEDKLLAAQRADAEPAEIAELEAVVDGLSDKFIQRATRGDGLSSTAQMTLLQSRLISLQKRNRALDDRDQRLREQIEDLENRISQTPLVESQLDELIQDRKFIEGQLQETKTAQSQAQTTEDLQVQGRAERIQQIEAASIPEKPSSPNRIALIVVSFIFSAMAGAICALGFEFLNSTIRGRAHLTNILDEPPLAIIPYMDGAGGMKPNSASFSLAGLLGRFKRGDASSAKAPPENLGAAPAE